MNRLFSITIFCFALVTLLFACVDDYEDANEARQLDPPDVKVSLSSDKILPGRTTQVSVNITDAPGRIDSLAINYDSELGTLVFDPASFEALKGKEKGSFTASWTSSETNVDEAGLTFTVYDAQSPRRSGSFTALIETIYEFPAPKFTLAPSSEAIGNASFLGGSEVNLLLDITTAPGGFGDVSIQSEGDLGTITIDTDAIGELKGKTTGKLPVKFRTPNVRTGPVSVSFAIFDNTSAARPSQTTTASFTIDSCSFSGDVIGTYDVKATGTVGDVDSTYTITSTVTLTQPRPGVGIIRVDDLSFGMYSKIYDRATKAPATLNFCDGNITERVAVDNFNVPFTINGTLNDDGTMTINWSNENGDTGEVTLTKQ